MSRHCYTGTKITRQQSATDITVNNSRLSLALTDLTPVPIEEDKKGGNFVFVSKDNSTLKVAGVLFGDE